MQVLRLIYEAKLTNKEAEKYRKAGDLTLNTFPDLVCAITCKARNYSRKIELKATMVYVAEDPDGPIHISPRRAKKYYERGCERKVRHGNTN